MDLFYISSTTLLICSLQLFLVLLFWFILRKINSQLHSPILIDLIFFFLSVKTILFFLMPIFFRMSSGYINFTLEDIDPYLLIDVYLFELIFSLSWLFSFFVLFYLFRRYNFPILRSGEAHRLNKFLFRSTFFGLVLLVLQKIGLYSFDGFIYLFRDYFYYTSLSCGVLLIFVGRRLFKFHVLLSILFVLFSLYVTSTRNAIMYSLLLIIFGVLFIYRSKFLIYSFSIIFLAVLLVYFSSGGLPKITNNEVSGSIELGLSTDKKGDRSAYEEIEWRFGALTRYSTSFFIMAQRDGHPGILPMKHSFQSFLPRSVDPDKPIPNTVVPDLFYTQGMYLIWREVFGEDHFSMVEFSSGSHIYWEFGMINGLFYTLFSSLFVFINFLLCRAIGVFGVVLMFALSKPFGYVEFKIWGGEVFNYLYHVTIPFLFIVLLYKFYLKFLRLRY